MSHRIDIELTSESGSTWTWRAAGARQPKGTLDASLLYPGASVGDVVRAEAERELEGTRIISVTPPRHLKPGSETIEIISKPEPVGAVSVTYAERDRGGDRRDRRREGPERGDRERGSRDGVRRDRPGGDRPGGDRPGHDRVARGPRPEGDRRPRGSEESRGDRPARESRPPRTDGERPANDRVAGDRVAGDRVAGDRVAGDRVAGDRVAGDRPGRGPRPDSGLRNRPKRLMPGRVHRDALLTALSPEQRPVAEQLFRGGIPAVRQAIIDQNAQLKAAGQTEIPPGPLLAMADELLARTRQADWLDRAQAALDVADDIALRDLRAIVTQADGVARDDASRQMSAKLREAMARRVEGERVSWASEISAALDEGRVVRAVRLSGKVPDPGAKLPPEITTRLIEETNTRLQATTPADQWAALIEAAAEAPFRRDVVPVALPEKTSEAMLAAAAQASNRIPALLKLLGLSMPPPPRPKSGAPRSAQGRPVPPPPTIASLAPPVEAVAPSEPAESNAAGELATSSEETGLAVVSEMVVSEMVVSEMVVTETVGVPEASAPVSEGVVNDGTFLPVD